jgi:hypothetical protein
MIDTLTIFDGSRPSRLAKNDLIATPSICTARPCSGQTRLDSAVNRSYRLLRNGRVDYLEFATSSRHASTAKPCPLILESPTLRPLRILASE